jgi:hypothetical protein
VCTVKIYLSFITGLIYVGSPVVTKAPWLSARAYSSHLVEVSSFIRKWYMLLVL